MKDFINELLEYGFILQSTPRFDIIKYRDQYFRLLKRNEQYCKITARSWAY